MKISRFITLFAAAGFGIVASTVAALAVPAVAKSAVNVRTGPNVSYTKVDTLHKGEAVNVVQCKSGWCYVEHSGPDGWVSGNYLAAPSGGGGGGGSSKPPVNFGMTFGPGGPTFSFSIGNAPPPPPAPVPTPKVCFFNGASYTGASFCVTPGNTNNKLVGFWNDRISSIKVSPGNSVTVCRNWFYGGFCQSYNTNKPNLVWAGFCQSYNTNKPNLVWALNNKISSYQTF